MHPDQLNTLLRRGVAEAVRRDFVSFIARSFATVSPGSPYLHGWHIEALAEHLEAVRRRDITRLIVNLPPRSLKSVCASVAWPAFLLGQNPSVRIMAASYSSMLSVRHSLDCRHIVLSDWYRRAFPEVALTKDQNEKHKFVTTQRGGRFATSIGGTATGEGGDILIVDDPTNPQQAQSRVLRSSTNRWFDHTFSTRLDDKKRGAILVVMQRLHAEDLTGHLLEQGGWEQLVLPAMTEERHTIVLGEQRWLREAGELLHPAREGEAELEQAKRQLGSHAYAAQYQQQPVPQEGGVVQAAWLQRYVRLPEVPERVIQSWDTAIKAGQTHDYSACVTCVEAEGQLYVAEVLAERLEFPRLRVRVMEHAAQWNADAVLIEDKASGQSLLQELRASSRLPLVAVNPTADKLTRLAAVTPMLEAGRVLLPRDAVWLAEFERELIGFPNTAHDDRVDAFSQLLGWLREGRHRGEARLRRL